MQVFSPLMPKSTNRLIRILALVLPVLILLTGLLSRPASAENTFLITDGDQVTLYSGSAEDPAQVLNELGVELSENDFYTTAQNEDGIPQITVQRSQLITVNHCGKVTQTVSYGETVESLLSRQGIPHSGEYVTDTLLTAQTANGMTITIDKVVQQTLSHTVEVPYQTLYQEDPLLEAGKEQIVQVGSNGESVVTQLATYRNGQEESRVFVKETVVTEPVDQIILRGTYTAEPEAPAELVIEDGCIYLPTGEVLTYTHTDVYKATAYTSWIEDVTGTTATGTKARYGAVAVDPDLIPYGTRMFIVTNDGEYIYGIATAEDCGGGVNGKHIDLLSLDCTKGDNPFTNKTHMSMEEGSTIAARFAAKGLIDDQTKRYFTHFAHNCGMIRDELAAVAKEKYGFEATYDGCEVEV